MNDKTKPVGDKSKRRMPRILIIAAVIVVALSGFVGGKHWHDQPGFCANCHSPMNEYVENYYGGDTTLMITRHAMADTVSLKCLDCHSQKLNEQLTEGAHWLTGNYTFPLKKRELGTRSFCMTAGCHVEEEIIKATTNTQEMSFAFSQHEPRHGKQECYTCHSMHGQSVYSCNQCHHFKLPEGWISPQPNGVIASIN